MVVVLMGPAGAGKSTIGPLLAARRGAQFVDADDFHTAESVRKMAAGIALDEAGRTAWIETLALAIDDWLERDREVVLACSALRAAHRKTLRRDPKRVLFVHLRAPPAVLEARLRTRRGHFAGPRLLASQLAALEEPLEAIAVDATQAPEAVVASICAMLMVTAVPET
jgi:gluconokinase